MESGMNFGLWVQLELMKHEKSLSLVQVEGRIIEPKNRILLPSMQRDLPSEEGTDRGHDTRGSESDGD
jgi:hypothetical protein